MRIIGKTEKGKRYHILNRMTGGDNFSLCGCYMPKDKNVDNIDLWELHKKHQMCEKCMNSAFFKQDRD